MAEEYSRENLRRAVASVCRTIGWHGMCAGPLEVLVHVLEKYVLGLARSANRYAEHDNRCEPDLTDLALAFGDAGVRMRELVEYCRCVPPSPGALRPPHYPLPRESKLGFPRDGRAGGDDDLHDHLPPVEFAEIADTVEIAQEGADDPFKRPPPIARRKVGPDDDDRRARELSSVAITEGGMLSQAREGRLPEARTPATAPDPIGDRDRDGPKEASARPPQQRPDGKAKKGRSANGRVEKPKRKDRPSKRPPEPPLFGAAPFRPPPRPKEPRHRPAPPPPIPYPTSIPMPVDPAKVKKEKDPEPPPPPTAPPPRPLFFDAPIKEERADPEKLASQPDRSKMSIFKKISSKPKEHEPASEENGAVKFERPRAPPHVPHDEPSKRKATKTAVDLAPKRPAPEPAEEFDYTKVKIKEEPVDDYPRETFDPKPPPKEEKEKKKEKKKKDPASAEEKLKRQLEKKQQKLQNKIRPQEKGLGPAFPFFNAAPGLIPHPGLIPGLMPGGNLFSSLCENPALRGLLPPEAGPPLNPYSRPNGPVGLPLPTGPGLLPPVFIDKDGFGRPPKMPRPPNLPPYLRRPSLEVIPIEEDEDARFKQRPFANPALVVKEKERPRKSLPSEGHPIAGPTMANPFSPSPVQKANPVISVPPVRPDVTIKLNSPPERVKIEPEDDGYSEGLAAPLFSKEKDKSEKKKDKLHKKEKKDKEQRIKKKKDKKEKLKLKLERKKEKEEKQELKDRIRKEKKEKRKEKEKAAALSGIEGVVPKLTLKLGSSSPMLPGSPDITKKLNIKPVVKTEEYPDSPPSRPMPEPKFSLDQSGSPELASFSALVTRPPKAKISSKHTTVKTEFNSDGSVASSPPDNMSPVRKTKPSSSLPKYKRIYFKPIPKRNSSDFDDPINDLGAEDPAMPAPQPVPLPVPTGAHFYKDPEGREVWICPACGTPDNGTPMIGCDGCDGWYHWVCVHITVAPGDSEDWYCPGCTAKKSASIGHTGKKRGRKPKSEKLKEMH